jgi:hypothetical protein
MRRMISSQVSCEQDGGERRLRHLDREVEVAAMPDVHALALAADTGEQMCHVLDRLLRGGEPDALERAFDQRFESLDREREMGPRLSPATAWISSRISVRTVCSIARPVSLVSRM